MIEIAESRNLACTRTIEIFSLTASARSSLMMIKLAALSAILFQGSRATEAVEPAALAAAQTMDEVKKAESQPEDTVVYQLVEMQPSPRPAGQPVDHRAAHIDPCRTFCYFRAKGDCSTVFTDGDYCVNLLREGSEWLVKPSEKVRHGKVMAAAALGQVSVMSCTAACKRTEGCTESFCKPNKHCKGLFWVKLVPEKLCFNSDVQQCNPLTPVHCNDNGERPINTTSWASPTADDVLDLKAALTPQADRLAKAAANNSTTNATDSKGTGKSDGKANPTTHGTSNLSAGVLANANASKSSLAATSSWPIGAIIVLVSFQTMMY